MVQKVHSVIDLDIQYEKHEKNDYFHRPEILHIKISIVLKELLMNMR